MFAYFTHTSHRTAPKLNAREVDRCDGDDVSAPATDGMLRFLRRMHWMTAQRSEARAR